MMGVQATSARLFYDFCLDDHVPSDHILRSIGRHLDLDDVRQALKPFYSSTGRPSIDPELMIRMLIAGYCMGIRSERRLCEEVHLNLAYRWFCRLGLDDKVPDHSTFSKNRHGRFRESNVFRHLFETIVERCMAEGLVGADGFAVDASLIAADANKQRSVPSDEWKPEEVKDKACRAVREYLATLDDAAFGAASPVTPKFISRSDPAAQWTGAHKGHAFFAYATNYLIDTDHGVIVDVEAIRQAEVGAARTMLERTEDRFGLKPDYLTADSAYGSAESLAWLVKHSSNRRRSHRTFPSSTSPPGRTGRFRAPTSLLIPKGTDIRARLAKSWSSSGAPTLPHGPASPPKAHASIAPARGIVTSVISSRVAAQMRPPARFRVI
jgi:transposase